MTNTFYSWDTKKVETGFEWKVTKNTSRSTPNAKGRFIDTEIEVSGKSLTRARAMGAAKRWSKHLNIKEKKAA